VARRAMSARRRSDAEQRNDTCCSTYILARDGLTCGELTLLNRAKFVLSNVAKCCRCDLFDCRRSAVGELEMQSDGEVVNADSLFQVLEYGLYRGIPVDMDIRDLQVRSITPPRVQRKLQFDALLCFDLLRIIDRTSSSRWIDLFKRLE
jgi:hypothetical protein